MSGRAGGTEMRFAPGSQCQAFWVMLLLVFGKLDNGMVYVFQANTGIAKNAVYRCNPGVTANQFTRVLGEAVIRLWSNLPQAVQNRLFQEAVTSHGESIRLPLAVFLHDKHPRTSLGNDGA